MEILTRLNWVDILVVIIVLRMSYVAFQSGLSHEIFPLIGSIAVLTVSLYYYSKIALFIYENAVKAPIEILELFSFLVLAVVSGLIFRVLKTLIDKIIKISWHPLIEKFGGLIAGIVRSFIAASIVLIVLALIPIPYLQWSIRDRSLTGMYVLRIGPAIYEKVSGAVPKIKLDIAAQTQESLTKKLAQDKSLGTQSKKEQEKARTSKSK